MNTTSWLVLLYSLPTKQNTGRVALWRKLRKFGAIQIKTSTSLLPDQPEHYERFQWLAKQVREGGGEATLIRAREIEGMPNDKIIDLFNKARDKDYSELGKSLTAFIGKRKKPLDAQFADDLERFRKNFRNIREIDYFNCPRAQHLQMLLQQAEGQVKSKTPPKLDLKKFQGKTWLTRPRPEIDRVGSAWLIRKFIDPEAKFIFASGVTEFADAIPYDMFEAEFSHHGDDCTFETMVKRFGIEDKAARKIAEMIHDTDLEDDKFQRNECVGIDRVLKGWAKLGWQDEGILTHGFKCFDALYAFLQRL